MNYEKTNMESDTNVYSEALKEALRVDFLENSEELFLYAKAIYSAMMWSREVDEKNRIIREKDMSVK